MTFEMGKQYTFDIVVSLPGIEVNLKEIEDWDVETFLWLKNISEKHFRGIILVNKLSPNDHGNKDSIYNTLNNKWKKNMS